jgi:hypothetical protein
MTQEEIRRQRADLLLDLQEAETYWAHITNKCQVLAREFQQLADALFKAPGLRILFIPHPGATIRESVVIDDAGEWNEEHIRKLLDADAILALVADAQQALRKVADLKKRNDALGLK